MTRETKIGLLVGLAFIIVIGILLSDHMTSTTDPPQARLDVAADNVRKGIVTPAPAEPVGTVGGGAASVVGQPLAAPTQPVLTRGDLRAAPEPEVITPAAQQQRQQAAQGPVVVQHVEVGGPTGAHPPIVFDGEPGPQPGGAAAQVYVERPAREVAQPPVTVVPDGPVAGARPPQAADPGAARTGPSGGAWDWARQMGEEVVSADARGDRTDAPPAPAASGPFQYKAEAGDTLSKLAGRFLGGNTKANRELILRANPSLKGNPDRIIVGRTYVIPAGANAPAPQQQQQTPVVLDDRPTAPPPEPRRVTQVSSGEPALGPGQVWYTVKENDNLWKIAAEQLGSGNAWLQVRDLNKDVLKGGDTVVPKMRLRLPARPVASAG